MELGIDVNTADMYYPNRVGIDNYALLIEWKNGLPLLSQEIPAWSLTALLNMLDYEVVDEEGESCYLKIDKDDIEYQIRYEDRWNSGIETKWYDNPLDAAFEMVCWLKENRKI